MKLLLHPAFILCLYFLGIPPTLSAAEVTNLRTHFSSSQMIIEYDLLGKSADKDSAVEVLLDIHGKRYSSHMLSMSGDFGRSVPRGKNRRIIWMHPQDFPEGLDTTFKCIVNSIPNGNFINEALTPAKGLTASSFAVNKQTVVETRNKHMWARNANIHIKPMQHSAAQIMIARLNQDRYAGYNDWRMPTREDFEGLFFFGKEAGWGTGFGHFIADYLDTCGFTHIQSGNYWTSTAADADQNMFFVINTWNGITRPLAAVNYYHLWPVRDAR